MQKNRFSKKLIFHSETTSRITKTTINQPPPLNFHKIDIHFKPGIFQRIP